MGIGSDGMGSVSFTLAPELVSAVAAQGGAWWEPERVSGMVRRVAHTMVAACLPERLPDAPLPCLALPPEPDGPMPDGD